MPSKYRLTWLFFFTAATVVFFIAGIAALAQDSIIPWHEEEKVEDVLRETILWRSLVLDFKNQLAKGAADKNLKISFLNTPLGKHTIEDLLAYTISGDGSVTTQMHDTVKQILLQPEELYWMWQFLLEHGLENLPDSEADDPESAEFRISLRVGAKGKPYASTTAAIPGKEKSSGSTFMPSACAYYRQRAFPTGINLSCLCVWA